MLIGLTVMATAGLACSSKKKSDGQITLALDGLPKLEAQVPDGTEMSRNAVGLGVMLKGPEVSMTIGKQTEGDADSLEEAKDIAQSYSPEDMKHETLPDGFILTYTNQGNMGTNYWLVGRRVIDEIAYSCGVKSTKKAHQQSAIAICKSLKK